MKFLVDQAMSPSLATWLRDRGHDAVHVRDRGMSSANDTVVMAAAADESRTLISVDLDFPRLLALAAATRPSLIVFRAGNLSDGQMIDLMARVLDSVTDAELMRSVTVVTEAAIRIAPLPLRPH